MCIKQDRTYARTAQDLERKYQFGKTFADMLGLINDNRDKVDSVESELRNEIVEQSTKIMRDTEAVVVQATETIRTEFNGSISDVNESVAELEGDISDVSKSVQELSKEVELKVDADGLNLTIEQTAKKVVSEETEGFATKDEIKDFATTGDVNEATKDLATKGEVANVNTSVTELKKEVELKVDADGVAIVVERELANGVDRVETKTGYTFDYDGLTISKSGEEMSNVIDNTGMYVMRDDDEILTANNEGVGAVNLHAKTYLIVGADEGRSRFEDYGTNRTGCFWIGG